MKWALLQNYTKKKIIMHMKHFGFCCRSIGRLVFTSKSLRLCLPSLSPQKYASFYLSQVSIETTTFAEMSKSSVQALNTCSDSHSKPWSSAWSVDGVHGKDSSLLGQSEFCCNLGHLRWRLRKKKISQELYVLCLLTCRKSDVALVVYLTWTCIIKCSWITAQWPIFGNCVV